MKRTFFTSVKMHSLQWNFELKILIFAFDGVGGYWVTQFQLWK